MTFNNSATYTTIQLSQILRNLADIFECSDREKIVKLYADSQRITYPLSATYQEALYGNAQYKLGLCLALVTMLRPWGSRGDRITCNDIVEQAIHSLYPPQDGSDFDSSDPFAAYGASYFEPVIDWKFRAEAARRIADWIIKNFEDYTLIPNQENDNEQL